MEDSVLAQASAEFTPDTAGVRRFLDLYLDFYVANPHIASLWTQRRLRDAADIANIEGEYTTPQVKQVAETVADAVQPGLDLELCLWTIAWCVQDFVQGGIPDAQGNRIGHSDPETLARFRTHLHSFVPRMIGLPG
jgi:AcrR family transcriptional regulator